MSVSLTQSQRDLYEYIKWYQDQCGIGPSYQEMMEKMHLKSKSGIHRLVSALCEKGYLRKPEQYARARSLEVVEQDKDALRSLIRAAWPYVSYEAPYQLREKLRAVALS